MLLGRMTAAAAALMALVWPADARADVVMSPREDCPAGSFGDTCHGGPHCRPLTCTADADCRDGKICRPLPLCFDSIDCGSHGGTAPTDVVEGTCGGGAACASGDCRSVQVCAPRRSTSDSGCRVAPGGPAEVSPWWLALAAAGLLARRRRRA